LRYILDFVHLETIQDRGINPRSSAITQPQAAPHSRVVASPTGGISMAL
jgi:hypothetical protein